MRVSESAALPPRALHLVASFLEGERPVSKSTCLFVCLFVLGSLKQEDVSRGRTLNQRRSANLTEKERGERETKTSDEP